jgi:hypothetical protein
MMSKKILEGQLVENTQSKQIGEVKSYHTGDIVRVNVNGDVELWEVKYVIPMLPEEKDPDVLFFQEELSKIVNGQFSYVQYHHEEDQWEAVVTFTGKATMEMARNVDQVLQSRFGACWKMWLYAHDNAQDLHVLYWS